MRAQSCPGCGARIVLREEGNLATCLSCGSSYLKRNEALERVADHRYLEARVDEATARGKRPGAIEAELVFLPFWVIQGRFKTEYTLSRYKESFFSVTRTLEHGAVDNKAVISVPACRTESALGFSLPLASSVPLTRCHLLLEGAPVQLDRTVLATGHWFSGTKNQERAVAEARRFVMSRHRLTVEGKFPETDIRWADRDDVSSVYLVHRPFWVFRDLRDGGAVDAHTGELVALEREQEQAVSHSTSFRANRLYTMGRVAAGFVGACLCLAPALLASFMGDVYRLAILVPSSLALLFFLRLFVFGLYSPYKLMSRHPSVHKVGVFTPRIAFKGFDDPDSVFWGCTVFLYLPLVVLPLVLFASQLATDQAWTVLGLGVVAYALTQVGGVLPLVPLAVVGYLLISAVKNYVMRVDDRSGKHSVSTASWFGIPALFVVVVRALITLTIAVPMLAYALILDALVLVWPALKAFFGG